MKKLVILVLASTNLSADLSAEGDAYKDTCKAALHQHKCVSPFYHEDLDCDTYEVEIDHEDIRINLTIKKRKGE